MWVLHFTPNLYFWLFSSITLSIFVRSGFKPNFQHTSSRLYISCMKLEINGWSVSGPIADGTKCPKNLARITFFLNNSSNTMFEVGFKPNSTPQNRLVRWGLHHTYILWNYLILSRGGISNNIRYSRMYQMIFSSKQIIKKKQLHCLTQEYWKRKENIKLFFTHENNFNHILIHIYMYQVHLYIHSYKVNVIIYYFTKHQ